MKQFRLPDIGEGIVECEVVEWKVAEGDSIAEDQPVVEVMTDKALVEITAPEAGVISSLHVAAGDMARVHEPLFAYAPTDQVELEASSTVEPEPVTTGASSSDERSEDAVASAGATDGQGRRVDFILPDIGEGIVECEIVEWHVSPGDTIEEDQRLVDVMTDKALVEITAPEHGVVAELYVAKGELARVHAPLYAYRVDGEEEAQESSSRPQASGKVGQGSQGSHTAPESTARSGKGPYGRTPASPAVRRLVREHQLKLEDIPGSGRDGRVLKEDVLGWLEGDRASEVSVSGQQQAASSQDTPTERVEPLKGIRAAMARQMVASASTIPHFHYGDEFDITELLALRERLKPEAEARELRLTLMPFFMKAMALAVQEYPLLNARLDDEASEIHYQAACNIGMAVDGKAGLMVPSVKGVETLSLLDIASEVQRLTEAARQGRVGQQDLAGGTISISNIGALGGTYAAPIINAPEVAIVAIGKTQWLPRFNEHDEVVKRAIMTVTWGGDHRLLDGGTIARFCNRWKGYLEQPESMLLQMR
ncbi:dihydrolipoyllysine-residue acetyltransferase [Halomonas cupida]|uniref:dihydrolipoyllysine-residue acetyltransferase n=1 Tax=Halomonas cupida TaxID=44933 RepID=UPI0039B6797F